MALITTAQRDQLTALFIGMFKATPGADNLSDMVQAVEAGDTIYEVGANLAAKAEFEKVYPGFLTGEEFADRLIDNLLTDDTPAAAKTWSKDWILGKLNAGESRTSIIVTAIIALTEGPGTSNPNYADANATLTNKVEVANYYSITKELSSDDLLDLQTVIADVTSDDDTVETAKEAIDDTAVIEGGQTYALTTNLDTVQGNSGDNIINATVGTNAATGAAADTFQSFDVISGGEGSDTLNISISTAAAAVGPTVSGVETINFTGYVAQDYNMTNTTGVETLVNRQSIVAASFTNVRNNVDLVVEGVNNQDTTLSYSATVNATLTDTQDLILKSATGGADITFTGSTVETLNISSQTAANRVDIGGTAVAATKTIVVTGDQNLTFTDTDGANAMAGVTSLTSTALTGNLSADLRSSATDLTVTTGAGNDTITVANLTQFDSFDLGEGSDRVVVRVADVETVTIAPTLTNVERISFVLNSDSDDASEDSTFRLSGATSLTRIDVGATSAATATNESQITLTAVPQKR